MFYGHKSFTVKTAGGAFIQFAAIYIYLAGTSRLAVLASSKNGGALSNPIMTDENGAADCWLLTGFYDAHAVHPSIDFADGWERNFQISTASDNVSYLVASTVLTKGGYYSCNCATGNQAHTMPPISSVSESEVFGFKKTDATANTVTLISTDGALFDTTPSLTDQNQGFYWAARSGVWTRIGIM